MVNLKQALEKFLVSPFAVLLMGVIIIASNLVWFLPTIASLRQSVSDVEKATVKVSLTQINKFLDEKETMVNVGSQFLDEKLADKKNQLILQKILRENHFTLVVLADKTGNEIIKYDKFKTVFPEDMGNILDREDFKEALRTGQPSWSKVFISEKFEPVITYNVPVYSLRKEIIGVLSSTFIVSAIFKTVADVSHDDAEAYVVDGKGTLISHSDLSLVLKNLNYSDKRVVADALLGDGNVVVANDDTYLYENNHNIPVLSAAAKVVKTGWVVVYEESKTRALASITRLTIFAVGGFIFITFLVLVIRKINIKVVAGQRELEKNLNAQQELFKKVEESNKNIAQANTHLQEKDKNLAEKIKELEEFQKFVVNREIKMVELKQEVAELKKKIGEHPQI